MGFGKRLSNAFRAFFGILSGGEVPGELTGAAPETDRQAAAPASIPSPQAQPAPESSDRAVQILAILQRDGRLIDFFTEDINPYSDAQIGAAVRDLHQSCRESLEKYIQLEPVIASDEGLAVTVQDPIDPASVKLIGNVAGKPPLQGILRHKGWQVKAVNLPPLPSGRARSVIAPAEIEIP